MKKLKENPKYTFESVWAALQENARQIGGISHSNGEVAESYFINSFEKNPFFAGQKFEFVQNNVRKYLKKLNLRGEYDLLLCNGTSVAIIEIKYKAKKEDVEGVLKRVENFKLLFPHYENHAIYLGLAGLTVNKSAEQEAIKQGVAVIKQLGDSMVINDGHLKVF
jgi:hypothetical protein